MIKLFNNLMTLGSLDLSLLKKRIDDVSEQMNTLVERVGEIETVADSAIELITSLKQELDLAIAGGDMGAVQELSDRLGAQTQELAEAISLNTPVPQEDA